MTRSLLLSTSVAVCLALGACSSDDDDGNDTDAQAAGGENMLPGEGPEDQTSMPAPGAEGPVEPDRDASGNDTSAVAGLWDAGTGAEARRDERYVLISDDGLYTDYDFRQDAFAEDGNCYVIEELRLDLELEATADTPATFSLGDGRSFTAAASATGDELTVTFEDGEAMVWPAAQEGLDPEGFTACDG